MRLSTLISTGLPPDRCMGPQNTEKTEVGAVAERLKATVLKTVGPKGPGGSNPSCSVASQTASMPAARLADRTVLTMSMPMVIGPTPPGTGVISEAFSLTASKSTSPTSR